MSEGTDPRRRFAGRERVALYLAADGRCEGCGCELRPGWHADHVDPHSRGGLTDVVNGQALCPPCNLKKGARVEPTPRPWQKRFIAKYHASTDSDFLLVACPGAGKTLAAGFVARDLLRDGVVDRLLIVVPTAALREQWMDSLAQIGIVVDGLTMNNGRGEKETIDGVRCRGWVVTYQSLYSDRATHRILNARRPTAAILDEIHHLGEEASWGKAAVEALGPCKRRLGQSGTPFRGTRDAIPFVEFGEDGIALYRDGQDGKPYPRGFDYSYGRALNDEPSPVRPILFDQYAGDVTWLDQWTDQEKTVSIADKLNRKDRSKANKHVLDTRGDWLHRVLSDADARLSMVRAEGDPAAQGLVLCIDTQHAYVVQKLFTTIVGQGRVAVAVSKDLQGRDVSEQARQTIADFGTSSARWLVAVAMVSEGIDIPTLRVGVWATIVRSELKFRQGIGRIVRRTGLSEDIDQTSYLFVPKDPKMADLTNEVYEEVKLALLDRDDDPDLPPQEPGASPAAEQDELPFDAFRDAIAKDPSIHVPGLANVDPQEAARISQESGQPLGAVAAVLAAMVKLGTPRPDAWVVDDNGTTTSGRSTPKPPGYGRRLKKTKGDLEALLRQVTSAWLRRDGLPYSQEEFSKRIARVKVDIYRRAEIQDYDRADIPAIKEAIAVAKKWLAEL